jgi:guanylate kinase
MKLKYNIPTIAREYGIEKYWEMVETNNPSNEKPYHNLFHLHCMVKYCYEIAKSVNLGESDTRLLLLAAMYHDFGHFGTNDHLNVIKAKQIFRVHTLFTKNTEPLCAVPIDVEAVETIISATQYPYVIDDSDLNQCQQIIRDADLLQWTEDTFIDHVVKGLSVELGIPLLEFIPKQRAFMMSMHFHTDWAQKRYYHYLDQRIQELDEFVKNISSQSMHKRIILVARAASGKDFLREKFIERGFKQSISMTTRPPRPGEVHGKDYYFINNELAQRMIDHGDFYEYVYFNNWLYGTTKDQFNTDDIFIMTPAGLSHVKPEDRKQSLVIYLDIPWEVRKERLEKRAMPGDTVQRRLEADDLDFKNFTDYDVRICNSDF